MAEVRVEIEIVAPVDKVFNFVADVETHPLYADFVESVRITSVLKRGKGVTFTQVHRGSEDEIESEILEVTTNKKITWITHESGGDVLVNYWFDEIPTGVKLIHTISSSQFVQPQKYKSVYDANERELANLKELMEKN